MIARINPCLAQCQGCRSKLRRSFTKGCIGERPATAQERLPTNPLNVDHHLPCSRSTSPDTRRLSRCRKPNLLRVLTVRPEHPLTPQALSGKCHPAAGWPKV